MSSFANWRVGAALAFAAPVLAVGLSAGGTMAAAPDIPKFCVRYAGHATSESILAQNLRCITNGPFTWSTDNAFHLNWCLSQFGDHPSAQQQVDAEKAANALEAARLAQLQDCQANPPAAGPTGGGGGQTVKVEAQVTMYDTYKDDNNDLCYLHRGDTLTKLSPDGAKAPWIHLKGNSGDCSGKTGYVYNNGEVQ